MLLLPSTPTRTFYREKEHFKMNLRHGVLDNSNKYVAKNDETMKFFDKNLHSQLKTLLINH